MAEALSLFKPPEGLLPNELVVWARRTKSGSQLVSGGAFMYAMGIVILITTVLSQAPPDTILLGIFIILSGAAILLVRGKIEREKYYLTNFRVLRTDHGRILDQLSRKIFLGKNLSEFIDTVKYPTTRWSNNLWAVRILNPSTGGMAIDLGVLSRGDVKRLEKRAGDVYCQFCGEKNDPRARVCSTCNASL